MRCGDSGKSTAETSPEDGNLEEDAPVPVAAGVSEHPRQEKATQPVGHVGFRTAGGKAVAADEGRRERAQALFASLNDAMDEQALFPNATSSLPVGEQPREEEATQPVGHVGFMTAGGKAVAADEGRRERAQALFASLNDTMHEQALFPNATSSLPVGEQPRQEEATQPVGHVGFRTAGGKAVAADEGRRERAQALFASLNDAMDEQALFPNATSSLPVGEQPREEEATQPVGHVGFMTAGGKAVAADEGRRERAQALFASLNDAMHEQALFPNATSSLPVGEQPRQEEATQPVGHVGFRTAGGKAVAADEGRRERAQALFASLNDAMHEQALFPNATSSLPVGEQPREEEATQPVGHVGFMTAGGKAVAADEGRRERAQALFASLNDTMHEQALFPNATSSLPVGEQPRQEEATQPVGHVGFRTAGGKAVAADEGRRERAQALFASLNDAMDEQALFPNATSSLPVGEQPREEEATQPVGHVGFMTAGGKAVEADEGRRERAQALFASLNDTMDEQALFPKPAQDAASSSPKIGHSPQHDDVMAGFVGCEGDQLAGAMLPATRLC